MRCWATPQTGLQTCLSALASRGGAGPERAPSAQKEGLRGGGQGLGMSEESSEAGEWERPRAPSCPLPAPGGTGQGRELGETLVADRCSE